jgi:hypothetical protein
MFEELIYDLYRSYSIIYTVCERSILRDAVSRCQVQWPVSDDHMSTAFNVKTHRSTAYAKYI